MIVKVHKRENRTIVAVCDGEILGQKFEEGDAYLDLTGDFYKGEERSDAEIGDLIRNADVVNLVGQKSVNLGLKEEIIEKKNVIYVKGVPHAQAIIVHD